MSTSSVGEALLYCGVSSDSLMTRFKCLVYNLSCATDLTKEVVYKEISLLY